MPCVPIIDLFAGPGGLGEGFSAPPERSSKSAFKIRLSIEMDSQAHKTLRLRSFYRQFGYGSAPEEYYRYLRGEISLDSLFSAYPKQAGAAAHEAWQATLGETNPAEVTSRISAALNGERDWLLIGGPPCQAYSLVGRSRMIGQLGRQEFEKDHRHFLYREYLRIIATHQPAVFVMENVKGLLSAKVNGDNMFNRILADLQDPLAVIPETGRGLRLKSLSYRVFSLSVPPDFAGGFAPNDFIIRAEDYSVPQARHRVIIVGIRDGFRGTPDILKRTEPCTVREVIGDLPKLRSGLSNAADSPETWHDAILAITKSKWLNNASKPEISAAISHACGRIRSNLSRGNRFVPCKPAPARHEHWYMDLRLEGVCNHETRAHISSDLHRYLFAAVYAAQTKTSPMLEHFPKALLPEHNNVSEALLSTKFNDRFRVQLAERPSTTVVSHISKDGHYYIHYDPHQCRSLTVREAARLQTFPDNYFFEGPRTEQYRQVGNAVPPLLASQIAKSVARLFH